VSSFDEAKFWVDPYIARGLPNPKGSVPRVKPGDPLTTALTASSGFELAEHLHRAIASRK
jgi:hypothetical protein